MPFKIVKNPDGEDVIWKCTECGRTYYLPEWADAPAYCECEFEEEEEEEEE